MKKPLCTGDLLPARKIFIERPAYIHHNDHQFSVFYTKKNKVFRGFCIYLFTKASPWASRRLTFPERSPAATVFDSDKNRWAHIFSVLSPVHENESWLFPNTNINIINNKVEKVDGKMRSFVQFLCFLPELWPLICPEKCIFSNFVLTSVRKLCLLEQFTYFIWKFSLHSFRKWYGL